jgi:peptide/nickel transport system ATP-binding protein/oligopeptide transport system ATP-binding protein
MYASQVVESGPVTDIFERPLMPYTAGLLKSIPRLGSSVRHQRLETIPGQVPMLSWLPSGCRFRTRCAHALPACAQTEPPLSLTPDGREVRCLRWAELALAEGIPV